MLLQPPPILRAGFLPHPSNVLVERQRLAEEPLDREQLHDLFAEEHVKAALRRVHVEHDLLTG
jgi:hypothetical protein